MSTKIESLSSLDGFESPCHHQLKLDKKAKKLPNTQSNGTLETKDTQTEQGHVWNDRFGFKVQRAAKVEYEWAIEKHNVPHALFFHNTRSLTIGV